MTSLLRRPPFIVLFVLCLMLSSLWLSEAGCPYGHDDRHEHRHHHHRHHHSHHSDDDDTSTTTSPALSTTDDSSTDPSTLPPPPYTLPTDYETWTATDKLDYIWSQLLTNQTTADLVPLSDGLIFKESFVPTLHFNSDLIPAGRRKAIHGDGVVCKVRVRVRRMAKDEGRPSYTGVLGRGSDTAILRLSSVLDPSGQLFAQSAVGCMQFRACVAV